MTRTEDITRPTTANIYDTSSLSTITEELATMLIESKANQENKMLNQIQKIKNPQTSQIDYNSELDHKLDRIAEKIGEKINEDLETIANDIIGLVDEFLGYIMEKVKEKSLSVAKDIRRTYVYNLGETPAAPHNKDVTEAYASELTFSHPYKEILKILQINCTSSEISKDEAETLAKKRRRKKLYVPEMAFRSEAIHIIKQIDRAIRVDESGKKGSGRVQPDKRICIT
ncbi:13664_t:CDS:2 [Racocetra fulgida]|uniref:13664_t:CDS:1 n=1 Tax=Racocetra fulgida TaxID=60492 RepID=A0A9N9BPC9_9GLOM|nr:13664_t:CDS:2 [Racocetra fulgida]